MGLTCKPSRQNEKYHKKVRESVGRGSKVTEGEEGDEERQ